MLCHPPFDGCWTGSPGADAHGTWSLLVPAKRENLYQNGPSLSYFHHVMCRMEQGNGQETGWTPRELRRKVWTR